MALVNSVEMAPNGPHFSEFVQGYWRMNDWRRTVQEHLTFLKQHVDLGITTVDHAHVYGQAPSCEELFGRVLKLDPGMRANIQIVSKCGIELVDEDSVQVNHYDSTPRAIEKKFLILESLISHQVNLICFSLELISAWSQIKLRLIR